MMTRITRARAWIAANLKTPVGAVLAALLLGGTLTVVATVSDPGGGQHTITIKVQGQNGQVTVTAPQAAVKQAQAGLADHTGSRSEDPAGVPQKLLDAGQAQQESLAATDQLPIVTPDAAPSQRGCVTRLVRNYSTRRGVRPRWAVMHYTVSPNRPGWSDVDAVVAWFDNPASQASSNFVIDGEGHCAYIVRTSDKAWTQAAANPLGWSIEFVALGTEPALTRPQLARAAQVIHDQNRVWQIPNQLGSVAGCSVARGGIIDHAMLGLCGGGHHDLQPLYGSPIGGNTRAQNTRRLATIIAAVRALDPKPVSAVDRRTCARLNAWRQRGRPAGHQVAVNVRRRQALARRGVTCTPKGPVRR